MTQTGLFPNDDAYSYRPYLRTGRVTSPVSPVDDPDGFRVYQQQCLATWSVDVLLDSGEYMAGCRIISDQANEREGNRRMLRLPQATTEGEVLRGDQVVVGFLNGSPLAPVVLGGMSPSGYPTSTPTEIGERRMAVRAPEEWQDRHEFVDLTDPAVPLSSHTTKRDSGLNVETEHRTITRVDGSPRNAHVLERDRAARSLQTEHMVETGLTTSAVVRTSNMDATDLEHHHIVRSDTGTSMVATQDLEARVLQLTQTVDELHRIIARSENAKTLSLQHDTPDLSLTAVSDMASRTASIMHRDKSAGTQAGVSFGAKSVTGLRRAADGEPESFVSLNDDGSVTVRSASGPVVHVSAASVLVSSGSAAVMVSEEHGVSVTTTGGATLNLSDDAAVVSAPAITVNGEAIHLNAGVVRTGSSARGDSGVPSVEILYVKLLRVEQALDRLYKWSRSHSHRFIGTASGSPSTTQSPTSSPGNAPVGQFNSSTAQTDALQTLRGD